MNDNKNKLIAWKIAHEVMQKSKEQLQLIVLHPSGEQYECLTLLRSFEEGPLIMINLKWTSINVCKGNKLISPYPELYRKQRERLIISISDECRLDLHEPLRSLPVISLFLDLVIRGMDITTAWFDGSSSCGLRKEAEDFPYYPLKDVKDTNAHWPWWIVTDAGETIAVCNINTGELVLRSAKKYQINNGEEKVAMSAITKLECEAAIAETQKLLDKNDEWRKRYAEYADIISSNIGIIKDARQTFRELEPLKFYLNVTNAKGAGKTIYFDVRYLGQAVAELKCSKDSLKLSTQGYDAKNQKTFNCSISLSGAAWDSSEARKFRSHFKSLGAVVNRGNEEHRIESMVLSEMLKTQEKVLRNMAPVLVGGLRFPMPTPLKASNHKSVSYAKHRGGGIDVLARVGTGGVNTKLCIMELKDENKPKEPPKEVIKQALIYTTFIKELIRSESGSIWWKLFEFGSSIPDQLVLYASCAMPSNDNNDTSFAGEELSLGGNDIVRLHYLYFEESGNKIDNIDTSINK